MSIHDVQHRCMRMAVSLSLRTGELTKMVEWHAVHKRPRRNDAFMLLIICQKLLPALPPLCVGIGVAACSSCINSSLHPYNFWVEAAEFDLREVLCLFGRQMFAQSFSIQRFHGMIHDVLDSR